jgi:hypothetical protein
VSLPRAKRGDKTPLQAVAGETRADRQRLDPRDRPAWGDEPLDRRLEQIAHTLVLWVHRVPSPLHLEAILRPVVCSLEYVMAAIAAPIVVLKRNTPCVFPSGA